MVVRLRRHTGTGAGHHTSDYAETGGCRRRGARLGIAAVAIVTGEAKARSGHHCWTKLETTGEARAEGGCRRWERLG